MDVGDDDPRSLAAQPERLAQHLAVADAHRHDHLVEAAAPGGVAEPSSASAIDGVGVRGTEPFALSRLNSTGSMAADRSAPAIRAPWMALAPIPPMPTTATYSPGCTSAAYTAEPQPVTTPQPSRQALSSGPVVLDLDAARLVHDGVLGERAEQAHQPEVLAVERVVAGGAVADLEAGGNAAPLLHRLECPVEHDSQRPHGRDEPEHDVVARRRAS